MLDGLNLTPGQLDALRQAASYLTGGAIAGGGLALGAGVLRNANPRYNPPEAAKPVIVDVPYPARGPVAGPVPIPRKTKRVGEEPEPAEKAANDFTDAVAAIPGQIGGWLKDKLPAPVPVAGGPDAQTAHDVPIGAAALVPAAGLGMYGGYRLGDQLTRAVERRRAQAELDQARQEYQDAVNARAARIYFPKAAADFKALLAGEAPADPVLSRAKAALDAAWEKRANDPPVAPAGDVPSTAGQLGLSAFFPWLLNKDTARMGFAAGGALGALGGYMGYNKFRDAEAHQAIRKAVEARDRANAQRMSPPVVARLVPVPAAE